MKAVDRLWYTLRKPLRWRVATRRIFLLLLPAALPLWLAALVLLVLVKAFGALLQPLVIFWSAPPRHAIGYHSYHARGSRSARTSPDLIYLVRTD